MPDKHGKGTYHGFMSPPTGVHTIAYQNEVRIDYGKCREKHPQETRANKAMCAAIAHTVAKGKYGR